MSDENKGSLFDQIRSARASAAPAKGQAVLDVCDVELFPCLTSLMVDLPTGAVRGAKGGKLSVFLHDGRVTICVNVPSMSVHAFYSADGFGDALSRLEGALAHAKLEWRKDSTKSR